MSDDYSPRFVGNLSKPLQHTFIDGEGKPHDLTGVNAALMTFIMKNKETNARKVGQGSWTIDPTTAQTGLALYHWNANDVNEAGLFDIQASVPFPDGTQHFQIKELLFKAPL
jgi:hypothetical protein